MLAMRQSTHSAHAYTQSLWLIANECTWRMFSKHSIAVCLLYSQFVCVFGFFYFSFSIFFSCLKNWMHLNLFFFSFKYSIPIGNDLNERRKKQCSSKVDSALKLEFKCVVNKWHLNSRLIVVEVDLKSFEPLNRWSVLNFYTVLLAIYSIN